MDSLTRVRISSELYKQHAGLNAITYLLVTLLFFIALIKLVSVILKMWDNKDTAILDIVIIFALALIVNMVFDGFLTMGLYYLNGYLTPTLQMLNHDIYVNTYTILWAML